MNVTKLFTKFICILLSFAYNTFIHLMRVWTKKPKPNQSKKPNTMSANITLNKNRKNAAIFIAHKVAKTKKAPSEKDVLEAAERHMETKHPRPDVVAVIMAEVKHLLKDVKHLPPIAPPLGEVKPKAPVPTPKSKGDKAVVAKATTKPKRKLATK